ncbi:MAG: hypothetical protein HC921_17905 [Synechococcaceae cyanobacterium SM2_3_1]|nr:hypothetical protein [Synechococcaceae cyanobacterium SM2_3_1]
MPTITALPRLYKPLIKPNQVICGTGQTAVVTGWTVRHTVAKHLQSHEYAAIGQLYSPTRGISALLRNLLANPQVRFLVLINATKEDRNAGAITCLQDFFEKGFEPGKTDTGRPCWLIRSEAPGYIDHEIAPEALQHLRQSLQIQLTPSISEAMAAVRHFAERDPL